MTVTLVTKPERTITDEHLKYSSKIAGCMERMLAALGAEPRETGMGPTLYTPGTLRALGMHAKVSNPEIRDKLADGLKAVVKEIPSRHVDVEKWEGDAGEFGVSVTAVSFSSLGAARALCDTLERTEVGFKARGLIV